MVREPGITGQARGDGDEADRSRKGPDGRGSGRRGGKRMGLSWGLGGSSRARGPSDESLIRGCEGDRGRPLLARVQPPSLGQWRALRVVAIGDHIQGYLDGKLLLDH